MIRQYATFRIEDALFGIDVLLIDGINANLDIVHVARAPEYVQGLMNLRGQIVTVIDMGIKFGRGSLPITEDSRCVILKTSSAVSRLRKIEDIDDDTSSDITGLLVSRVEDMLEVDTTRITSASGIFDTAQSYVSGVVQLESELLNILHVRSVVAYDVAV